MSESSDLMNLHEDGMNFPSIEMLKSLVADQNDALERLERLTHLLTGQNETASAQVLKTHYHAAEDLLWKSRDAAGTVLADLRAYRETVRLLPLLDLIESDKVAELEQLRKTADEHQDEMIGLFASYNTLASNLRAFVTSFSPSLQTGRTVLLIPLRERVISPPRVTIWALILPVSWRVGFSVGLGSFLASFHSENQKKQAILYSILTTVAAMGEMFWNRHKFQPRSSGSSSRIDNRSRLKSKDIDNLLDDVVTVAETVKDLGQRFTVVTNVYTKISEERDAVIPLFASNQSEGIDTLTLSNQETFNAAERSLYSYSRLAPGMPWN